jgi:sugar (pentulose or hexulose) kinase
MRCYTNGAQFLDGIVGANRTAAEWSSFTDAARHAPPLCNGTAVLPFALSEPSIGVHRPRVEWYADGRAINAPADVGTRVRAAFEAIAYLIALGVRAHEEAGQSIEQVTVSGGIARNELMVRILAAVLNRPLKLLKSDEGTALGAAVVALAGAETSARRARGETKSSFTALEAAERLVAFRETIEPEGRWVQDYRQGLAAFEARL